MAWRKMGAMGDDGRLERFLLFVSVLSVDFDDMFKYRHYPHLRSLLHSLDSDVLVVVLYGPLLARIASRLWTWASGWLDPD